MQESTIVNVRVPKGTHERVKKFGADNGYKIGELFARGVELAIVGVEVDSICRSMGLDTEAVIKVAVANFLGKLKAQEDVRGSNYETRERELLYQARAGDFTSLYNSVRATRSLRYAEESIESLRLKLDALDELESGGQGNPKGIPIVRERTMKEIARLEALSLDAPCEFDPMIESAQAKPVNEGLALIEALIDHVQIRLEHGLGGVAWGDPKNPDGSIDYSKYEPVPLKEEQRREFLRSLEKLKRVHAELKAKEAKP